MPEPITVDVPADKYLRCPAHGHIDQVEVIEYTRPGGVPGMHLRAACECGQWVAPAWFVPRRLAGLEPREKVE